MKQQLVFCLFVFCFCCLLPRNIWSAETIKCHRFVFSNGRVESVMQPVLNVMPYRNGFSFHFSGLCSSWINHKIIRSVGAYSSVQQANIASEFLALYPGVTGLTKPVSNNQNDKATDSASKNGQPNAVSRSYFFLGHVLSGMAGALIIVIKNQMGVRWTPKNV